MQMSNKEIVSKFNRADNKKEYVKILAQLNGCSEENIIEILRKNDIPESELPKKRGRKPVNKKIMEAFMEETREAKQEPEREAEDTQATESAESQGWKQEAPQMQMPEVVSAFVNDEIERITKEIMALEEIRDDLCDFRDGRGKWQR